MMKRLLPFMVRRSKVKNVKLTITTPDGHTASAGSGDEVTMTGTVHDLLLRLYGRESVVDVKLDGPSDAVARVEAGSYGI